MNLFNSLPHLLILLELDDVTGKSLQRDAIQRHFGLTGAVLAELMWRERLIPTEANKFILRPGRPAVSGSLRLAEDRLSETRPRTIQKSLQRLRAGSIRKAVLSELVEEKMLDKQTSSFLVLFRRRRWVPTESSPEQTYIEHLRQYVDQIGADTPPQHEDLMLSLLRAVQLLETVWTASELASMRERIVLRTERAPIGRQVHQAVELTRAAMAAAAVTG